MTLREPPRRDQAGAATRLVESSEPASIERATGRPQAASRQTEHAEPAGPVLTIRTAAGETLSGRVRSWQIGANLNLETAGEPRSIPTVDIVQADGPAGSQRSDSTPASRPAAG